MKILCLILILSFLSHVCSAEQAIQYKFLGTIDTNHSENKVLQVSFSNTGNTTICVEDWVVDRESNAGQYRDVLMLYSASSGLLQSKVPSAQFASDDQLNPFVYYVKPNTSISASYYLEDLYEIHSGEYSVTMFLDIALCDDYLDSEDKLESSNNLKYLSMVESLGVAELNHFFSKSESRAVSAQIVALPLLSFEVP